MMVGNGATDWDYDVSPSFPEVAYQFNLIPHSLFKDYQDNGCVVYFNDQRPMNGTDKCPGLWDKINDLTESLNWYDLYRHNYNLDNSLLSHMPERYGTTMIKG